MNWNHNPIVKRLEVWLKLQNSGTLTRLGEESGRRQGSAEPL